MPSKFREVSKTRFPVAGEDGFELVQLDKIERRYEVRDKDGKKLAEYKYDDDLDESMDAYQHVRRVQIEAEEAEFARRKEIVSDGEHDAPPSQG